MTETDAERRRAPAEPPAAGNGGLDHSLDAGAALAWRYEQLRALHEMTEAVSGAEDVEGIYEVALDGLTRTLRAGRASILLFDQAGVMRFRAWRGLSDEYRAEVDGHSPWAPDTVDAEPIVVADAEADESVEGLRDVLRREGIRALAFVPLLYRGRLLGKFMIYYPEPHELTEDELRLAQTIANQVAFASQRKLEEEALRESRDQLEVIFRGVADGITVQDRTGNLVFANDAATKLLGYESSEELLESPAASVLERFELFGEDGRPMSAADLPGRVALRGENPPAQTVRWRIVESGDEHWSIVRSAPVVGEDGEVQFAVNIFHDVTDQRRAEERFRFLAEASEVLASSLDYKTTLESLARLAVPRLADCCVVDVVEWDTIHQIAVAHVDPALEELVRDLERRYPADPEVEQSPVGQVLRTGRPELLADMNAHRAGIARDESHLRDLETLALVSGMITPLVVRGTTVGALTFLSAARRYTEQDLAAAVELADRAALAVDNARLYRESEERGHAARVLEAVGDGVFLVDSRGVVRLWNPAAEAITGLAASELVGRPAADSIPGWDRIAEVTPVSDAPGPGTSRAETLPLDIEDREVWLSISGVGFSDGTVYAFRDLTEERRVEQLKTEFVATASHELRTPLAAVYGAAMTLRRPDIGSDPAVQARLLAVIAEESDRLARTINDILWASRLETGQLEVSIESFDIAESAAQIVEAMRAFISESVSVELDASGLLPPVAGDPDKVRQVLTNLIDNAVKYSPDGGRVEVKLERRDRCARVLIRDEGLGIPPSEQSRIFEKFYRLDPNLTRGVGGTGLGLYICRELVRRMDGRIWVDSAEGEGSTFFFELPLAEA